MARTANRTTANDPTPASSIEQWLAQQSKQERLNLAISGSLQSGKSALISRLLQDTKQRHEHEPHLIHSQQNISAQPDDNHPLANTEVAYHLLNSPCRSFRLADTSGQAEHTRHMVAASSRADALILVVDAAQGITRQTQHHAYIASLLGIRQIILAINKIDLNNYNEQAFNDLQKAFNTTNQQLSFDSISAIPISALHGDNLITRSSKTAWYQGPTLMACLETLATRTIDSEKSIFPIEWVNQTDNENRGLSGTLASGQLALGDKVRVTTTGQTAQVVRIITPAGEAENATAEEAITVFLDPEIDAAPGDIIARADQPLEITDQFEANLIWMDEEPGLIGRTYEIKLANQWANASLTNLKYAINVTTHSQESCRQLQLNDIAVANLALSKPLVFDTFAQSRSLGSFILVDKYTQNTVAAGMIRHNLRRAQNVHRQALSITRDDREQQNGHKGKVIWFTGLSGSGKSTIANALEKELHAQGKRTYILDGDNIRQGLNKDLGFTDADRVENIRRVAEVAKLMMDAGLIVMTAFISPFRAERQMARDLIGEDNFIEVFVDTPLAVCEGRDPKGLYKKARSGQLPNMTGINSPYEPPATPDVRIDTTQTHNELILEKILRTVSSKPLKLRDATQKTAAQNDR